MSSCSERATQVSSNVWFPSFLSCVAGLAVHSLYQGLTNFFLIRTFELACVARSCWDLHYWHWKPDQWAGLRAGIRRYWCWARGLSKPNVMMGDHSIGFGQLTSCEYWHFRAVGAVVELSNLFSEGLASVDRSNYDFLTIDFAAVWWCWLDWSIAAFWAPKSSHKQLLFVPFPY